MEKRSELRVIDYHCHILHSMDDGARNLEESVAMAKAAADLGFTKIIATPHFEEGVYEPSPGWILRKVEELNQVLSKTKIPITICPGSEIALSPQTPDLLQKNQLMSVMNQGTHLLVELPLSFLPIWGVTILLRLKAQGYIPVLAHPERYPWINEYNAPLQYLRESGIEFQSNLGSLAGRYGRKAKAAAEKLSSRGLVSYWGSDAHSTSGYYILDELQRLRI